MVPNTTTNTTTNTTVDRPASDISPAVREMLAKEQKRITVLRIVYVMIAIAVLIYSAIISDIDLRELFEGSSNSAEYANRYFPPDFTDWRFYLADIIETVCMGVWGTLLAAVVAAPLSVLAAENISPPWVVQPVRRIFDTMRAINEVVFALMFVVAVGLGPFAGVLALFVHTTGTLGKLFSEAIENIDLGPIEGVRASGASKVQEILFGVIPQVMPPWISFTLYRFEANVRSASVLGIVGAGGIGVSLYQSFRSFKYPKVCAILIILIVAVSLLDVISAKLRRHFI